MENATPKPPQESLGRILVVDDNRDNVEIIATRLRFRGYEILEASDGARALEMARTAAPDLILLDVMLPDTNIDDAEVFVERVRREVARRPFNIGRDEPLRMTISAGVAAYPHSSITDPETLVRVADEALYAAKSGGRNRVVRFDQLPEQNATTSSAA